MVAVSLSLTGTEPIRSLRALKPDHLLPTARIAARLVRSGRVKCVPVAPGILFAAWNVKIENSPRNECKLRSKIKNKILKKKKKERAEKEAGLLRYLQCVQCRYETGTAVEAHGSVRPMKKRTKGEKRKIAWGFCCRAAAAIIKTDGGEFTAAAVGGSSIS